MPTRDEELIGWAMSGPPSPPDTELRKLEEEKGKAVRSEMKRAGSEDFYGRVSYMEEMLALEDLQYAAKEEPYPLKDDIDSAVMGTRRDKGKEEAELFFEESLPARVRTAAGTRSLQEGEDFSEEGRGRKQTAAMEEFSKPIREMDLSKVLERKREQVTEEVAKQMEGSEFIEGAGEFVKGSVKDLIGTPAYTALMLATGDSPTEALQAAMPGPSAYATEVLGIVKDIASTDDKPESVIGKALTDEYVSYLLAPAEEGVDVPGPFDMSGPSALQKGAMEAVEAVLPEETPENVETVAKAAMMKTTGDYVTNFERDVAAFSWTHLGAPVYAGLLQQFAPEKAEELSAQLREAKSGNLFNSAMLAERVAAGQADPGEWLQSMEALSYEDFKAHKGAGKEPSLDAFVSWAESGERRLDPALNAVYKMATDDTVAKETAQASLNRLPLAVMPIEVYDSIGLDEKVLLKSMAGRAAQIREAKEKAGYKTRDSIGGVLGNAVLNPVQEGDNFYLQETRTGQLFRILGGTIEPLYEAEIPLIEGDVVVDPIANLWAAAFSGGRAGAEAISDGASFDEAWRITKERAAGTPEIDWSETTLYSPITPAGIEAMMRQDELNRLISYAVGLENEYEPVRPEDSTYLGRILANIYTAEEGGVVHYPRLMQRLGADPDGWMVAASTAAGLGADVLAPDPVFQGAPALAGAGLRRGSTAVSLARYAPSGMKARGALAGAAPELFAAVRGVEDADAATVAQEFIKDATRQLQAAGKDPLDVMPQEMAANFDRIAITAGYDPALLRAALKEDAAANEAARVASIRDFLKNGPEELKAARQSDGYIETLDVLEGLVADARLTEDQAAFSLALLEMKAHQSGDATAFFEQLPLRVEDVVGPEAKVVETEPGTVAAQVFDDAIDTPEFRRWFGESKVVDEEGKPKVVYHGTSVDFEAFDAGNMGAQSGHPSASLGHFFAEAVDAAALFTKDRTGSMPWSRNLSYRDGAAILPTYLSIRNPKVLTAREFRDLMVGPDYKLRTADQWANLRDSWRAAGHDGVKIEGEGWGQAPGLEEWRETQWIAFSPEQIKSVHNRGTWSSEDPNILRAFGEDLFDDVDADALYAEFREALPRHGELSAAIAERPVKAALSKLPGRRFGEVETFAKNVQEAYDTFKVMPQGYAERKLLDMAVKDALRKAWASAPDARTRGADAFLRRLDMEARVEGSLGWEIAKPDVEKFINMVGRERFEDLALSIKNLKGNTAGTYSFAEAVIAVGRVIEDDPEKLARTLVHESWHAFSRYLPDDVRDGLFAQYLRERKAYIKAKPDEFAKTGEIKASKLTSKNYRYASFDEWIAETFADHSLSRLARVDASLKGSVMDALLIFVDRIRAYLVDAIGYDKTALVFDNFLRGKYDDIATNMPAEFKAAQQNPLRQALLEMGQELEVAGAKGVEVGPKNYADAIESSVKSVDFRDEGVAASFRDEVVAASDATVAEFIEGYAAGLDDMSELPLEETRKVAELRMGGITGNHFYVDDLMDGPDPWGGHIAYDAVYRDIESLGGDADELLSSWEEHILIDDPDGMVTTEALLDAVFHIRSSESGGFRLYKPEITRADAREWLSQNQMRLRLTYEPTGAWSGDGGAHFLDLVPDVKSSAAFEQLAANPSDVRVLREVWAEQQILGLYEAAWREANLVVEAKVFPDRIGAEAVDGIVTLFKNGDVDSLFKAQGEALSEMMGPAWAEQFKQVFQGDSAAASASLKDYFATGRASSPQKATLLDELTGAMAWVYASGARNKVPTGSQAIWDRILKPLDVAAENRAAQVKRPTVRESAVLDTMLSENPAASRSAIEEAVRVGRNPEAIKAAVGSGEQPAIEVASKIMGYIAAEKMMKDQMFGNLVRITERSMVPKERVERITVDVRSRLAQVFDDPATAEKFANGDVDVIKAKVKDGFLNLSPTEKARFDSLITELGSDPMGLRVIPRHLFLGQIDDGTKARIATMWEQVGTNDNALVAAARDGSLSRLLPGLVAAAEPGGAVSPNILTAIREGRVLDVKNEVRDLFLRAQKPQPTTRVALSDWNLAETVLKDKYAGAGAYRDRIGPHPDSRHRLGTLFQWLVGKAEKRSIPGSVTKKTLGESEKFTGMVDKIEKFFVHDDYIRALEKKGHPLLAEKFQEFKHRLALVNEEIKAAAEASMKADQSNAMLWRETATRVIHQMEVPVEPVHIPFLKKELLAGTSDDVLGNVINNIRKLSEGGKQDLESFMASSGTLTANESWALGELRTLQDLDPQIPSHNAKTGEVLSIIANGVKRRTAAIESMGEDIMLASLGGEFLPPLAKEARIDAYESFVRADFDRLVKHSLRLGRHLSTEKKAMTAADPTIIVIETMKRMRVMQEQKWFARELVRLGLAEDMDAAIPRGRAGTEYVKRVQQEFDNIVGFAGNRVVTDPAERAIELGVFDPDRLPYAELKKMKKRVADGDVTGVRDVFPLQGDDLLALERLEAGGADAADIDTIKRLIREAQKEYHPLSNLVDRFGGLLKRKRKTLEPEWGSILDATAMRLRGSDLPPSAAEEAALGRLFDARKHGEPVVERDVETVLRALKQREKEVAATKQKPQQGPLGEGWQFYDDGPVTPELLQQEARTKAWEIIDRLGWKVAAGKAELVTISDGSQMLMPKIMADGIKDAIARAAPIGQSFRGAGTKSARLKLSEALKSGAHRLGIEDLAKAREKFIQDMIDPAGKMSADDYAKAVDNLSSEQMRAIEARFEETAGLKEGQVVPWAVAKGIDTLVELFPFTLSKTKLNMTTGIGMPNAPYYAGIAIGTASQLHMALGADGLATLSKRPLMTTAVLTELHLGGAKRGEVLVTKSGAVHTSADIARMMKEHGVPGSFAQAEFARALEADIMREKRKHGGILSRMVWAGGKWQDGLIEVSAGIDNYFRAAVFIDELSNGRAVTEAADLALRVGLDYNSLSPFEKTWMRNIVMFYSYQRKMLELFYDSLLRNPDTIVKQIRLLQGFNKAWTYSDPELVKSPFHLDRLTVWGRRSYADHWRTKQVQWMTPPIGFTDNFRFHFDASKALVEPEPMMGRLTPPIKGGIELAMGRELFTGRSLDEGRVSSQWVEFERACFGGVLADGYLEVSPVEASEMNAWNQYGPGVPMYEAKNARAYLVMKNFVPLPFVGLGRPQSTLDALGRGLPEDTPWNPQEYMTMLCRESPAYQSLLNATVEREHQGLHPREVSRPRPAMADMDLSDYTVKLGDGEWSLVDLGVPDINLGETAAAVGLSTVEVKGEPLSWSSIIEKQTGKAENVQTRNPN